jgi:hypothetical protein
MLPQPLVLLVALALGPPWSSPVSAAPTSPFVAQPPLLALPVLGDSGRSSDPASSAGGQRLALHAHTLSQVAFGRGSSAGSSGAVTGQSGLRRRASNPDRDAADEDVVWEALGWVQNGGCVPAFRLPVDVARADPSGPGDVPRSTYSVPVEVGNPAHTFYLQIVRPS